MRLNYLLGLSALALAVAAGAACDDETNNNSSSSSTSSNGTGATTTTTSGTGGDGNTGNAGGNTGGDACATAACSAPEPPNPGTNSNPGLVSGHMDSLAGGNAHDVMADVCGTNKCVSGETDASGDFSVDPQSTDLTDVHMIHGNGKRFAKMAAPLPSVSGGDYGNITLINLPDIGSGAPIAAGQDATSNGVTLGVDFNTCIKHDGILYTDNERGFRANVASVSDGNFPAVDASLNLDFLVATAPINTTFCPGASLTFPNKASYPDDTEVEIFIHGTLTFRHYATYGGWAKVAEGVVDSGGATISTKPTESIELLGVFGVRAK